MAAGRVARRMLDGEDPAFCVGCNVNVTIAIIVSSYSFAHTQFRKDVTSREHKHREQLAKDG